MASTASCWRRWRNWPESSSCCRWRRRSRTPWRRAASRLRALLRLRRGPEARLVQHAGAHPAAQALADHAGTLERYSAEVRALCLRLLERDAGPGASNVRGHVRRRGACSAGNADELLHALPVDGAHHALRRERDHSAPAHQRQLQERRAPGCHGQQAGPAANRVLCAAL